MTVQVGDKLPDLSLSYVPFDPKEDLQACPRPIPFKLHEELKGKKAVIFAIPGAFTPTCSEQHVPEFLAKYDELKKHGIDKVICVSGNDGFVMNAFAKVSGSNGKVLMVSASDSGFFEALDLTIGEPKLGSLLRPKRFALLVDDLVVKYVGVENGPGIEASGPASILSRL
ncbi:thioredoxin-like protein [Phycomyces blakesleeanus]|uniref:Thioredoxin-like protein n=1 Tax=Phycomyces blakesleeanus TaxID=4837 RepID=A0ABR3B5A7_PHYBL